MTKLPSPSLLPYLFLENPWPVAAISIAAAVVLLFYAMRLRKGWLWGLAGGLGVLAVGVYLLAGQVVTPREQLIQQTRRLVEVVLSPGHIDELDILFADQVTLEVQGDVIWDDKLELTNQARRAEGSYDFLKWSTGTVKAGIDDQGVGQVRLSVNATVKMNMGDFPAHTTWRLQWKQTGPDGAWQMHKAIWLKFNNQPAVRGFLP